MYEIVPDTHSFLCGFQEMMDEVPDPHGFTLRATSFSPGLSMSLYEVFGIAKHSVDCHHQQRSLQATELHTVLLAPDLGEEGRYVRTESSAPDYAHETVQDRRRNATFTACKDLNVRHSPLQTEILDCANGMLLGISQAAKA